MVSIEGVDVRVVNNFSNPAITVVQALDVLLGLKFSDATEAFEFCRVRSDRLKTRWNASGQTDFGIYSDDDYIFEGLMSYYFVSKECCRGISQWTRFFRVDPSNTVFFDLYNGVGMMTVFFSALGFRTVVHNDNPAQQLACELLHDAAGLPHPRFVDDWRTEKFDWVGHFEVLEHFRDPVPVARDLALCLKSNGFMFESTGFADGSLPGHFTEYEGGLTGKKTYGNVQAEWKSQGLRRVYSGFSDKPRVWTRVPMNIIPKRQYIGAKNFSYTSS
jgi:hypothetical protein